MSESSPLASFLWHSYFEEVRKYDNFREWMKADMIQFCMLAIRRQMYTITTLSQVVGFSPIFASQYRQVNALINRLMKLDNVFRPLTAFEMLIISEDMSKILSKLYDILLSEALVTDKAKNLLGNGFGSDVHEPTVEEINIV